MIRTRLSGSKFLLSLLTLAATASTAVAGPPLVCHPLSIGGAKSLPWANNQAKDWNAPMGGYDTKNLANDTISLLDSTESTIVRMETLRRAAIYGTRDAAAALDLVQRVRDRALGKSRAKPDALALFDYGYLSETMKQAWWTKEPRNTAGPTEGVNGYSYIRQALELRGSDAEMEFAAALVTLWPKLPDQQEHFRRALSGAEKDPLLVENLLHSFQDRGKSLTELRESANLVANKN